MARCIDFPACGHESGCCPDYDEGGNQLNMKCTCGATVPLSSPSSLCPTCLNMGSEEDMYNGDSDGYDGSEFDETDFDEGGDDF